MNTDGPGEPLAHQLVATGMHMKARIITEDLELGQVHEDLRAALKTVDRQAQALEQAVIDCGQLATRVVAVYGDGACAIGSCNRKEPLRLA
jgi:hypothetical protein